MNTRMCAWCALGVLVIGVSAGRADTVTLSASKDNTLYQDDFGELSNGLGAYLFAGVNGRGETRRGVIAFDLSSIPAGSTVTNVSLRLRMSRTQSLVESVALHRALQDWGEGTSNAAANEGMGTLSTPGDATWIHTFYDSALWNDGSDPVVGGFYAPVPSSAAAVNQVGFYTWAGAGMIADAQEWVNNPAANFGWVIIGFENGLSTAKRFDSRNNATVANRPVLTVDYNPPVAACPCDMNGDWKVTSGDFFLFLTAFFSLDPAADFDGSGAVTSGDFFGFIACFFSPPSSCR